MRFLRVTIVVLLLLIVGIGSSVLYGRATPRSEDLMTLGFDLCSGTPCFMGIIPGVTTGKQVHSLLSKYDPAELPEGQRITARLNNFTVGVLLDADSKKVISLTIPLYQDSVFPRLESFIAIFGLPCSVGVVKESERLDLSYPNMSLGVTPVNSYLSLHSPLSYVVLASSDVSTHRCVYRKYNVGYIELPWLGFTRADHYQRRLSTP
jgi:hypothetical protein